MALLVLPMGLAGLAVSAVHLGGPPGGWIERGVFFLLDHLLRAWIWLVRALEQAGDALVFSLQFDPGSGFGIVYYGGLLLLIFLLIRRNQPRVFPSAAAEDAAAGTAGSGPGG